MTIPLLLLIPLAASGLTAIAKGRRAMETIHVASALGAFASAILLAAEVLSRGESSNWSGFLFADSLSALVALLTAFAYLACACYSISYFRMDDVVKVRKYYTLTPLLAFSMFLVTVASNLGVMWVAMEGTTLASIFLVTYYGRPTSLEAAWKYAMIGGVGLSMALFGTVLTYYSAHSVLGTESLSELNWSVLVTSASRFDPSVM